MNDLQCQLNSLGAKIDERLAENARLRKMLTSAINALRSYQYGNSSPDLAEEIADACEVALEAT